MPGLLNQFHVAQPGGPPPHVGLLLDFTPGRSMTRPADPGPDVECPQPPKAGCCPSALLNSTSFAYGEIINY
jgi:hypothetical protein